MAEAVAPLRPSQLGHGRGTPALTVYHLKEQSTCFGPSPMLSGSARRYGVKLCTLQEQLPLSAQQLEQVRALVAAGREPRPGAQR